MKTKKSLFLLLAFALVLLAGAAGAGYAYWVGTIYKPAESTKDVTVDVGKADDVTTDLIIGDITTELIDVELEVADSFVPGTAFTFNFDVEWKGSNDSGNGVKTEDIVIDIVYYVDGTKVEGSDLAVFNNMFKYIPSLTNDANIEVQEIKLGEKLHYTGILAFEHEPADSLGYSFIAGKSIKIVITIDLTNSSLPTPPVTP